MAKGERTLEYTPSWVVAMVCAVVVFLSLAGDKILHCTDKYLKKKLNKAVFEAIHKIKQELLLGIIALVLTTFQDTIGKICITETQATHLLPCDKQDLYSNSTTHHRPPNSRDNCSEGKVPLLTSTAWNHLHIFIFVLAAVHASSSILTILFAMARMRQWKSWEDSIQASIHARHNIHGHKSDGVLTNEFIGRSVQKNPAFVVWLIAFFRQFYGSLTKADYYMMRQGFIKSFCPAHPHYDFHKYMMRVLESDFKRIVGIRWYLWVFVVIFLLLNIRGWHAYFWIAFIPLILLLAVGTKLEHVISEFSNEAAEKQYMKPTDERFWFHNPRLVHFLIHLILFINSFQLAYFFWIWFQYSFHSCIMSEVGFIIPRLVIGAFIQFLCSYSTFPLYAIVTQMGSNFSKEVFGIDFQGIVNSWSEQANRRRMIREADKFSSEVAPKDISMTLESRHPVANMESSLEMVTTPEIIELIDDSNEETHNQCHTQMTSLKSNSEV